MLLVRMRNSCFFLGLVSLVIARELPISLLYLENFNWTPVPQPTNDPASEPDYQHWYPNPYIPSSEDERRLFSDSVVCFRQEEKNYKYRLEAPGQPLWNAIKAHCAAAAERYGVESNGTYNKKIKALHPISTFEYDRSVGEKPRLGLPHIRERLVESSGCNA